MFKIKHNPDGTIHRLKSILVAKGFHQQEALDYTETFIPVSKPTTIRLVLSLVVHNDWEVKQLDISNAFLHGDLQEYVYMTQPLGFEDKDKPHFVCQLHKSIYGLKHAPRAWYEKLMNALLAMNFKTSTADTSLFVYSSGSNFVVVLIYVDDILITGSSSIFCNQVISKLSSSFPVKDLGPIHYFLGLQIKRNASAMDLSQTKISWIFSRKQICLMQNLVPHQQLQLLK